MRHFNVLACLFVGVLAAGCGSKDSGGTSNLPGDTDDTDGDGADAGKGGKRDGGSSSSSGDDDSDDDDSDDDDSDDDVTGPGKLPVDPGASDFHKDATGGAGLSDDVVGQLKEGGSDCTANIVYPYEDTVFPAGLAAPTIMWEGDSDAAYLKLEYERVNTVSYELAGAASSPGELRIPAADWAQVAARTRSTPLLVTLTTKRGNALSTCKFQWRVAQGAMVGSVFYNTYNLPDSAGMGAVMRLTLGDERAQVYLSYQGGPGIPGAGPCISCHSVSFNGEMLAASQHDYTPVLQSFSVASYTVSDQPQPAPTSQLAEATFGAFTPDGKRMLTMGNPDCTVGADSFPRSPNNFPLLVGPSKAELHDTSNGTVVAAKGLQDDWYMWMPQFSPKGDKVVFNHAKPGPNGTDRRELAIMDFDEATNTFSNLRVLTSNEGPAPSLNYAPGPLFNPIIAGECTPSAQPPDVGAIPSGSCTGPCYPAWPFFTPDGEAVVYAMVSEPDFTLAFPGRDTPSKSELWYVDIASKEQVRLDNANAGLSPSDSLANYYPTVLPVAIGGYYWIFWTSTRAWGHRNLNTNPAQPISDLLGGNAVVDATKKRIWVSALRPRKGFEGGLEALTDLSAPAFYLEGQSESGNIRAFATLNPCEAKGNECETGLDCCTGFCEVAKGASKGVCVDEKVCAEINERCETDDDCCPAPKDELTRVCLGNFCGIEIPI